MILSALLPAPPQHELELIQRAQKLAGHSFAALAAELKLRIPVDLKRDKGWVGMLVESYLGARSGTKAEQDFAHFGIELKTIPVDKQGKPLETTFVCVAQLTGNCGVTWERSYIKHKLARVLWIPVEGARDLQLAKRHVGSPLLWRPSKEEEEQLRQDWEELMDMIVLGQVERITARHGAWLQIRPKSANSKNLTEAIGEHGEPIMTRPRGFYLKKNFTGPILAHHFLL